VLGAYPDPNVQGKPQVSAASGASSEHKLQAYEQEAGSNNVFVNRRRKTAPTAAQQFLTPSIASCSPAWQRSCRWAPRPTPTCLYKHSKLNHQHVLHTSQQSSTRPSPSLGHTQDYTKRILAPHRLTCESRLYCCTCPTPLVTSPTRALAATPCPTPRHITQATHTESPRIITQPPNV
jgi:hypothetical protein